MMIKKWIGKASFKGGIDMATISFDKEIILNDVSAELLLNKIEHDKKNKAVFKKIDVQKEMEEGRKLLKRFFSR